MKPIFFCVLLIPALFLRAEVITETVEYRDGDVVLSGFAAYDNSRTGKRPAVLIVHQWKGLGEYEQMRARQLAELGYVAFAVDIYGKGIRPKEAREASAEAAKYKNDRPLLRRRVLAGLEQLRKNERVDGAKVAAVGYCFGGTTVLELARSGAELAGVVSFHGGLDSPLPAQSGKIKARVLALHGADDPFVPAAEVNAFQDEMRKAKADWQLVSYGNAVHSFTDRSAGGDNSKGAAYNRLADRRSWEDMKQFFGELFLSN